MRLIFKYTIPSDTGFGLVTIEVAGANPVVLSAGQDPSNAAHLVAWVEHDEPAVPALAADVDFAVYPTGAVFDALDPSYVFVGTVLLSAWIVLHIYARPTP